jgi:hypothetical protein
MSPCSPPTVALLALSSIAMPMACTAQAVKQQAGGRAGRQAGSKKVLWIKERG